MERIHVSVRARPLSAEDAKSSPWRISGNSISIPAQSSKFEFDRVFGEDCKTAEVYDSRTRHIVAAAVRGFNGTVFAYGQTNSGKTHTMRGSASEPGIIPLAVHEVFHIIQQDMDREFLLRMSYMEIYNEDINDLLAPQHRKLQIHENLERGIYVAGLREEIVASPQQVLDLMQFGESHRHIGETNMNLYSSRSHTIFRMIIESRDRSEHEDVGNSCDAVRVSVLNLVDLAGSERASKTGAEGIRLKEGSHINKSLMTLGTVIKKLSEGAESQGGHVPYRDSKLTRILQPALGGNANTAIICNITLAQIHADETKSSLQFASRALRVTNCAYVNEILTDAALLKRQKKEIEELRAKLQGSHSEHLEAEILNLRNTLLQSELERERITLELEEEKKAQAECEKVLQEQAKRIKDLSSMVLHSSRDETRDQYQKSKRRDTWAPGNFAREPILEVVTDVQSRASEIKPMGNRGDMGPLLPFKDLVSEVEGGNDYCLQQEKCDNDASDNGAFPNPCDLSRVTRRKVPPRKRGSLVEDHEMLQMQLEYEELLQNFETQRTISEIRIDFLTRKLAEADLFQGGRHDESLNCDLSIKHMDNNVSSRELQAILVIKQLQEKIKMLEMEQSSSRQNLDSVVELATEHSLSAKVKLEELNEELQHALEEARIAHEQLASGESAKESDLSLEMEEVLSEVQNLNNVTQSFSFLLDEVFQSFSAIFGMFTDFKAFISQSSHEQKLIISNHTKLYGYMSKKVSEVENEKLLLYSQCADLEKEIHVLRQDAQNYEETSRILLQQQNLEKEELLSEIQILEKDISRLSSSSLAKEKENARKDLEKTKTKLKETEFKLKNVIQDKTKLESEKAFAEREVKRLHGEKTLLERGLNKRDSFAGRRDSMVERSSTVLRKKRTKGGADSSEQMGQEDYKKLEVLAFEMEATIASLEEEIMVAQHEKEEALSRNESVASELETMSKQLNKSNADLNGLQEEVLHLRKKLEESASNQKHLETIKLLVEEKEELAMQFSDSVLKMEEEKAMWFAKEKASIEAMERKAKLHNSEVTSLSTEVTEIRNALESCGEECMILRERLALAEENAKQEKQCSEEKSREIEQLMNEREKANAVNRKLHEEEENKKERAKLRMRLRGTQAKLDAFRLRYKQAVNEMEFMNRKYEEGSRKLKDMLALYGSEVLNLKKQLAAATGERGDDVH